MNSWLGYAIIRFSASSWNKEHTYSDSCRPHLPCSGQLGPVRLMIVTDEIEAIAAVLTTNTTSNDRLMICHDSSNSFHKTSHHNTAALVGRFHRVPLSLVSPAYDLLNSWKPDRPLAVNVRNRHLSQAVAEIMVHNLWSRRQSCAKIHISRKFTSACALSYALALRVSHCSQDKPCCAFFLNVCLGKETLELFLAEFFLLI